jgi:hypothetical protein
MLSGSDIAAQLSVIDMIGQQVQTQSLHLKSGYNKEVISLRENTVPGVYIIQLTIDGQSLYYHIVLNK